MTQNDRLMRLCTASPSILAQVDAVLAGNATANESSETHTITDAARLMGVSRPAVYSLIEAGRLDVVYLCGSRRVTAASIAALMQGGRACDIEARERITRERSARAKAANAASIEARKQRQAAS